MVTAKTICAETGMPPATLYRLVEAGKIPAERVDKPWHTRRHYRFCLDSVRQALAELQRRPPE